MAQREDVLFTSGGDRISAWLYRPSNAGDAPLLVMAHGLGAVRTMRLDAYAERFTAAGYACLVFDYRNFGDSEGRPRQLLDIRMQLADWAAAVGPRRPGPAQRDRRSDRDQNPRLPPGPQRQEGPLPNPVLRLRN
jgi:dienelactone hydrolase